MILALLLACAADKGEHTGHMGDDSSPPDDTHETADTDHGAAPPTLISPAEAVDLDADPDVLHVQLEAAPASLEFEVDGEPITMDGWAYNGQVPGPTLRAKRGDTVIVELTNNLPDPTTIHWHGLSVPHDMDGHTWMMDPIEPGASFTYSFTVDQPGTFWYHPHFDTAAQVDLGLYGAFIVEDPDDPAPDVELVLIYDDWEVPGYDTVSGEDEEDAHGAHGRESLWTVNRLIQPEARLSGGQTVRVRQINASNVGYLDLEWPEPRQIGGDQGLLAGALAPEDLVLAPGDRADLEWLPGEDGFEVQDLGYSHHGGATWEDPQTLLTVAVDSPAAPSAPLDWAFSGLGVSEDPGRTDLVYTFSGDDALDAWFINGERFPDVTVETVALGTETIVEVRNISPTEHPFHLHGNHFEVLSVNGVPPDQYTWEDTWNVGIYDTVRLRLIPDNPGDWMLHCHILPHAEGGMMSVLTVAEPDSEALR